MTDKQLEDKRNKMRLRLYPVAIKDARSMLAKTADQPYCDEKMRKDILRIYRLLGAPMEKVMRIGYGKITANG